jgi:hypothetical protein
MTAHSVAFRGYHAIADVIESMAPLANWLTANRPTVKVLTLRRRDLDLIQRWPQAATLHGIFTVQGVTHWRGFTLRSDGTRTRYERGEDNPERPTQTEVSA